MCISMAAFVSELLFSQTWHKDVGSIKKGKEGKNKSKFLRIRIFRFWENRALINVESNHNPFHYKALGNWIEKRELGTKKDANFGFALWDAIGGCIYLLKSEKLTNRSVLKLHIFYKKTPEKIIKEGRELNLRRTNANNS